MSYQVAKLIARISENLPAMPQDIMQGWIENPKGLQKFLEGLNPPVPEIVSPEAASVRRDSRQTYEGLNPPVPEIVSPEAASVKLDWRQTYEALDMLAEYDSQIASLAIREQDGFWLVPVIQAKDEENRLTCNKVVAGLRKLGVTVYLWADNLDDAVTKNDRDPNKDGSYVIHFKATVEADEENNNQSANQRKEQGCSDITLLERLLLELAYFLATRQHLDTENVTLSSGSRYSDGDVPYVYSSSGPRGVYVRWRSPGRRGDCWRARSAVSLPAKTNESQSEQV